MHWESIEMVKCLNTLGYDVDYADCTSPLPKIHWEKYVLIIDEKNNLFEHNSSIKAKKIFYATGCHWEFHNQSEEIRIGEFNDKFHLQLKTERKAPVLLSEKVADITTYFGNDFQNKLFSNPDKTFQLNLSTVFFPVKKSAYSIEERRNNFIWIGSRGFIHKGLDIVVEAFVKNKNINLHICTNLQTEPEFYEWFRNITEKSENIFYHGFLDLSTKEFSYIIDKCIAIPYLSCSEGGAGAVLQVMQFDCFPIVNEATALCGQEFGILLQGTKREDLLHSLKSGLSEIRNKPVEELEKMALASGEYARKNHSRKSYSESFKKLINTLDAAN
ncbi:hypothetical protein BH09BAC2_BH09BAC2_15970 [soil metagenome]